MADATIHSILTLPQDPIAAAEITASAIRADRRTGRAQELLPSVVYVADRGNNILAEPAETNARGAGQCFDLTRAAGGFRGTHVGCLRSPIGLHVFLGFLGGGFPLVYDPSVERGAAAPPSYDGAVFVPIWEQAGPGATSGPPGHDIPPAFESPRGTDEDLVSYVLRVGALAVANVRQRAALQRDLAQQLQRETDRERAEALDALLTALGAEQYQDLELIHRAILADVATAPDVALRLMGALEALSRLPSDQHPPAVQGYLRRRAPRVLGSFMSPAPISFGRGPRAPMPRGACPGSCALKGK